MLSKFGPFVASSRGFSSRMAVNLQETLANLLPDLKPPVERKQIFNSGLKFMIVGGPNQRNGYHVEVGDEIFYQLKGDMELKVILPDTKSPSTILIKEGHIFRLPGGIPHSTQRFEGTMGLVLERSRSHYELDCMRWYHPDSTKILYEEYFYCHDLGCQIKDATDRFNSLKASNTLPKHDANEVKSKNMNHIFEDLAAGQTLAAPLNLSDILTKTNESTIYSGEFIVDVYRGREAHELKFPKWLGEVWLYQYRGKAETYSTSSEKAIHHLNTDDIYLVKALQDGEILKLQGLTDNSIVMAVKNIAEEPMPNPGMIS